MGLRHHRLRGLLVGLLSTVLVLVLVLPTGNITDAMASGTQASAVAPRPVDSLGPRTVTLWAATGAVSAGVSVHFLLNVTGVNCTASSPSNESVIQVEFHFGDGFSFPEPPSTPMSCLAVPWSLSLPLEYAYRTSGDYNASASVYWGDGLVENSSTVVVDVTGRSQTDLLATEVSLVTAAVAVAAVLVACFVLRRRLPESPAMPPGKA